jgi:hypothetical protein
MCKTRARQKKPKRNVQIIARIGTAYRTVEVARHEEQDIILAEGL